MHQHDQSSCPDVVDQPGETDEGKRGHMVNDLLFKVLQTRKEERRVGWSLIDEALKMCH